MELFDVLLASALNGKSSGGSAADPSKPVKFFDYDGTLVHSYTPEEFAELSALPANPSHEGLTAQGWNWSLSDAKTYAAKYGALNVGQMYVTSDGKTRIKIKLEDGRLEPVLGLGINGTVAVDWGDGTSGTMTGSDVSTLVQLQHVYAAVGEYTIAMGVTGSIAFLGDYTYGSKLLAKADVTSATEIQSRTYQNAVQEVYIGNSITSIGVCAFRYCYSLTFVTIPDSITSVESSAFRECSSLTSVTFPDSVTAIGDYMFASCYSLASVTFPDSITSIGSYIFTGNAVLTSVTFPEASIGNHVFSNCHCLTFVTIPNNVTSIVEYFCYDSSALTSVTIPDSVTAIGGSAFSACGAFTSLTIPDGVTSIGTFAFSSCTCLTSVTIGSSVASIGNSAFSYCCSLVSLKFKGSTPPTVANSNAFRELPTDCVIYVPSGSLTAYKSAANYPNPSVYTYVGY